MAGKVLKVLSTPGADEHVAACGLFCTACGSFKKGRCRGCQVAPPFKSCPTRACCVEKGLIGCWDCSDFAAPRDYRECKKVNNLIARVISWFTHSDRPAALAWIRDRGREEFIRGQRQT